MNIIAAFLVTFLTANIPTLTGVGVSNFDQPILPLKHLSIRGGILIVLTIILGIVSQVTALAVLVPLIALAGVYGMNQIENQVLPVTQKVTTLEVIVYGGAATIFSTFVSQLSPLTPTFYAAAIAIVITYFVTVILLQLSQRRLRLATVPALFQNIPLLAMTLAILGIIFSGFTAIF